MKGKIRISRRLLAWLLTIAMLAGSVFSQGPVTAKADSSVENLSFTQTDEDVVDRGDLMLPDAEASLDQKEPYAEDEIVRVSIVLEKDSTIDAGFSTSDIALNRHAMEYRDGLKADQEAMTEAIEGEALDGQNLDVVWNLTLVANIISANVAYGKIEEIAAMDGVKEVILETKYEPAVVSKNETADPNMSTSSSMIGSAAAWAEGYTGAGSRIAIIDTGIDDDHQSFNADAFLYSLDQNAQKAGMDVNTYRDSLNLLDEDEITAVLDQLNVKGVTAEDLYLNAKVPFAYNYVDENLIINHDSDGQGEHGSHVTGIAAANAYIPDGNEGFSHALDTVLMQGVAPDAQVITMKVFGAAGGAYDSDYMCAIEDAIVLGADAVNLSLGSNSPGFSRSMTYQEIMESLEGTDTLVSISAGNASSWVSNSANGVPYLYSEDVSMDMVGAPGSYYNSLSVASVENDGFTGEYIQVGENMIFYVQTDDYSNLPINTLAGEQSYILIDGIGTEEEFAAIKDVLQGKIAVCSRGESSFYQKAQAAVENGAIATIIYNNEPGALYMDLSQYPYENPVISVTQADGDILRQAASPVMGADNKVLYYEGVLTVGNKAIAGSYNSEYYIMSDFSSWGVPGSLIMKPEITAPGGNIYSVNGLVPGGQAYEIMSGTSMAAPQVAGMAGLLAQYIKEKELDTKTGLTVRELAQSLLMSTAVPLIQEESGSYWSLLQQGSGLANISNAITAQSYITMNDDATETASDGKVKAELGDDPLRNGDYSYSFTLHNIADTAKTYSLISDFFTQDVASGYGYLWMDTWTVPLAMQVTYTVNGQPFEPKFAVEADVDKDGDTDIADAQAILDYAAGNNDGALLDLSAADLDGNGEVTTYDAHLLLANCETAYFTVEPGEAVEITVNAVLIDEQKAVLNQYYENGAYIEGYTYVEPVSTTEGEIVDVRHSIPVLGFYGNWSDASMYDKLSWTDYMYDNITRPYTGEAQTNNLVIQYPGDSAAYYMMGNPFVIEDTYPEDRVAVSSDTSLYAYVMSMIRNAAAVAMVVTNEAGEVLYISHVTPQESSAYFYDRGGYWANSMSYYLIQETVAEIGGLEGEKITASLVAIPEYYEKDGSLTKEQIKDLVESGTLGDGVYLSTTMMVDSQAPVIHSVNKDTATGALTIKAQDNQYLAYVAVCSKNGQELYKGALPEQTEAGQITDTVIDLSGKKIGRQCYVIAMDYAGNETTCLVDYGGEPIDYSGQVFGFTNGSVIHGTYSRWVELEPDKIFTYQSGTGEYDYGGMSDFIATDLNVVAAEYVDGYVYMLADDGNLYAAPHDDMASYQRVCDWSGKNIVDMAMNYDDGQMYVMEQRPVKVSYYQTNYEMYLHTMDMVTGELTEQYQIKVVNPYQAGLTKLSGLAIDDDGNFYGVSGYLEKGSYLYRWTNDMVENGVIDGLNPVSNESTGVGTQYGQLAWDHVKKILYLAGNDVQIPDPSNYLWVLNTETGKADPASSYTGEYDAEKDAVFPSMTYYTIKGMFVVPEGNSLINPTEEALSITLDKDSVTLMKGTTATVSVEILPWTIKDSSVTWTTSDPSVATVRNGLIIGMSEGTAVITATTNAKPNLQASCEVTVKGLPSVTMTGLAFAEDGFPYWIDFTAERPSDWAAVSEKMDEDYYGGALLGDVIYVHNNEEIIALDADSFVKIASYDEVKPANYWETSVNWQWTDAAACPLTEEGYFGHLVGIVDGTTVQVLKIDEENHRVQQVRSQNIAYNVKNSPVAAIAYAGTGIYNPYNYPGYDYPACFFYLITESGEVYQWISYTGNKGTSYSSSVVPVGSTGITLTGTSDLNSASFASMAYDAESNCLFLTANPNDSEITALYLIDTENLTVSNVGNFGAKVWPVVALLQHTRNTDLRMTISAETLEMYTGDTAELSVEIKPASYVGGVTWSSSDESVATVDANGVVTGVGAGTAVITAVSVDKNENGEQVSVSASVTVKGLASIDASVHAQITTEDGAKWVTINTSDLSVVTDADAEATACWGGGVHNGKIYFTGTLSDGVGNVYEVDPSNGYTQTQGGSYYYTDQAMLDAATVPGITNGDTERFNYLLFLSKSYYGYQYIQFMEDYTQGGNGFKYWYREFSDLGAIAYAGQTQYETDEGVLADAQVYYVLGGDGTLYQFIVWDGGSVYNLSYSPVGNVGMSFDDYTALSMTMVSVGDKEGLLIADSSKQAADLYYVELGGELTCEKVGRLSGATGISVLYTDKDLAGEKVSFTQTLASNMMKVEEAESVPEESETAVEVQKTETDGTMAESPEAETTEAETPETETPEAETPEAETPEAESPEAETSETEIPEVETPAAETTESATTEAETPEAENSGAEETEMTAEETEETVNIQPGGTLNAIRVRNDNTDTLEKSDGVIVDTERHTVTVNVKADDSTNGLFDVNYDSNVLTLLSVKSPYLNSYRTSEGMVTFAYADAAEISETVTTLIFSYELADKNRTTDLKVIVAEDGAVQPDSEETVVIELPGVDKSALQSLHDSGEERAEADYTADSWKVYETAMAEAKAVLDNPSATQEEVDAALEKLQAAIDQLKAVEKPNPDDDQKPDDETKPGDETNPDDGDNSDDNQNSDSQQGGVSGSDVDTGDHAPILWFAFLMMAAGIVLVAAIRRKKSA